MWSIGCLIHELAYFTFKDSNFDPKKRYLFKGTSCFPLSPCEKNDNEKDEKKERETDKSNEEKVHVISKDDQNLVILKDLGV